MVDPISNAPKSREIGPARSRSQAPSARAGAANPSGLASHQRVEATGAMAEKGIKQNPLKTSKLEILQDDESGGSPHAGAAPQLVKLRHYLQQIEGLLLDTEA